MESSFSLQGGANIGAVNATWPMATLEVSDTSLLLKVKLVGTYEFRREDVVSLEPHGFVPVIGKGVRIVHRKPDYSSKVIFWATEKPELLIQRIREAGFVPGAPAGSVAEGRSSGVRPVLLVLAVMSVLSALFAALGSAPR
jgi:hypothetical protein